MKNTKTAVLIKGFLFVALLGVLGLPMIHEYTKFKKFAELKGSIELVEKPTLTSAGWFSGTYQEKLEAYKNQNFGLRSLYIRMHNQLSYFFFKELRASGAVVGKENYLYEENYIKSYFGLNFVGDSLVIENTRKLKMVQDTLSRLNVHLLFVVAPGKGMYLPEYAPASYDTVVKKKTNYEAYVNEFQKNKIKYIDYNKWFLQMKDTTRYPLYGKGGIHWSSYGEVLVCDSLIKALNKKLSCKVGNIIIENVEVSKLNRERDYDIGEGLNLFFQLSTFPMAYPKHHFENNTQSSRCRLLTVADSYYWGLYNAGFSEQLFIDGKFWYYNEQIYPESATEVMTIKSVDIKKEVEKQDVILILSTEMNLSRFSFGFIDQLYATYYPQTKNK